MGGGIQESFTSDLVTHIITDCKVTDRGDVAGSDCDAVIVNVSSAFLMGVLNALYNMFLLSIV